MTYTTVTAIERRLEGWASTNPTSAFAETAVDTALVEQLIEQACARIDRCLSDRYQLPLAGDYPELASCAEKLVMCQLIGQLYAGQQPSESGGYGALMCSQGERELKALKVMDFDGQIAVGDGLAGPVSGVRSLPGIYKRSCSTRAQKIDPIRW